MIEEETCEKCGEEYTDRFKWNIAVTYGANSGLFKRRWCAYCISKFFNIPIERIRYFREVVEFKKGEQCPRWNPWTPAQINLFCERLKRKKIEIRDYGISIYEHRGVEYFLHKVLDDYECKNKFIDPEEVKDVFELILDDDSLSKRQCNQLAEQFARLMDDKISTILK